MSPLELTSRERRRLLRRVIWRHGRPHLLFVAVLQVLLLLAKVGGGIWLPSRSQGAVLMDMYQNVGLNLIAFLLVVALLRGRVAFIPLLKRLPILPDDEYRARFEVAFLCGSIVLASVFAVELCWPACDSALSSLSRTALFFLILVGLLSYGASLGRRSFAGSGSVLGFYARDFLFMACVFRLFDWIWRYSLRSLLYVDSHGIGIETWRQIRWPVNLFAISLLCFVVNRRRATHGHLLPRRFALVADAAYLLFIIVYLLRDLLFLPWLGKTWKAAQDPGGLSSADLWHLMMYMWILPLGGAFLVAGIRAKKWRRLDVLLARLPVTPQTVARSRLGELVRLWGALILIPAFLQLLFTHALGRYPLGASVVSWAWLLALSLSVLANVVLTAFTVLLTPPRYVVPAVGLIFFPEYAAVLFLGFGNGDAGAWFGPLSVSLLAAVFTALGMWMTYGSIQRRMTPVRWAIPDSPGRTSPPAITAFQEIP